MTRAIRKLTHGPRHHFFGYYDKCLWDALPGFEPSHQFRRRVMSAIEGILAERHGQRIVVVTHGGVLNAYLSMILDIPRHMFFLSDHASISVVRKWRDLSAVQGLNDIAHLLPTFDPW
jgi:broad specificity phosphatase PhoE